MNTCRLSSTIAMLLLAFGSNAFAQQSESGPAKPFLLVEGQFDRNYVSDLYSFDMGGKLIKRLTSEPLPSSGFVAIAPGRGDTISMGYALLSLRHNLLFSIHPAGTRVPAFSRDGGMIAFVSEPEPPLGTFNPSKRAQVPGVETGPPLVLHVAPLAAGLESRAARFLLPEGVYPSEMTFTPDGEHVLITHWAGGRTAQLLLVNLKSGAARTVLGADGLSYYAPAFAPDGKSLLAVREDFAAGRFAIVSLAWPDAKAPAVILTSPLGVELSTPIFLADGKRFLFQQDDALARATLDGKTVDTLFGELNQKGRTWNPGLVDRRRPVRAGWIPQVVTRYFARVEWRERETPTADSTADLVVIDVQTGQRTTVPMPSSRIRAAVVVE